MHSEQDLEFWSPLELGSSQVLKSSRINLKKGVWLVYFYNCLNSISNPYYLNLGFAFQDGAGNSSSVNMSGSVLGKPDFYYERTPFRVGVISSQASGYAYVQMPQGGTIVYDGSIGACSYFKFIKIS